MPFGRGLVPFYDVEGTGHSAVCNKGAMGACPGGGEIPTRAHQKQPARTWALPRVRAHHARHESSWSG